jgi:hypothetical protein
MLSGHECVIGCCLRGRRPSGRWGEPLCVINGPLGSALRNRKCSVFNVKQDDDPLPRTCARRCACLARAEAANIHPPNESRGVRSRIASRPTQLHSSPTVP